MSATLAKFDFSSKLSSGNPVVGMGLSTVICGICPMIVSITFMSIYASLLSVVMTAENTAEVSNAAVG